MLLASDTAAHHERDQSAADDGHHQERGTGLGVVAEAAQAHREDGRKLDRHEEAGRHQRVQADVAAGGRGDDAQHDVHRRETA